jgi:hypothetical protein
MLDPDAIHAAIAASHPPPAQAPGPTPPLDPPGWATDFPSAKPVAPEYKGAAIVRRGLGNRIHAVATHFKLGPHERQAIAMLHSPESLYNPRNHTALQAIIRPGPSMQKAIDSDPVLTANHDRILIHLAHGTSPNPDAQPGPAIRTRHPLPIPELAKQTAKASKATDVAYRKRSGGAPLEPTSLKAEDQRQLMEATALAAADPLSPASVLPKLAGETAKTAIGIGPGLYHLAGGEIHHPVATTGALVHAIAHSYGQSIHDPVGQWERDPLGLITNAATPFFAGAGAATRAAELAKTAGAVKAGELAASAAPRSVARTLMRPQSPQRNITLRGPGAQPGAPLFEAADLQGLKLADLRKHAANAGVDVKGLKSKQDITDRLLQARGPGISADPGTTIHPPSFKSGLGQYLQKVHDAWVTHQINSPKASLGRAGLRTKARPLHMFSAEASFGRNLRYERQVQQDLRAGLSTRLQSPKLGPTMPAQLRNVFTREDVSALLPSRRAGRLTKEQQHALLPQANDITSMSRGQTLHSLHQDLWHSGKTSPDQITGPAVAIKAYDPFKTFNANHYRSENAMANRFNDMFPTRTAVEKDPSKFRYVPEQLVRSLTPYSYHGGVTDMIDRGTQIVRAGRFLHPGYVGWAAQNGILHLSQSGGFAFRNLYKLRTEVPKLSEEAMGRMEALSGAGIAHSTEGETPFLSRTMRKLGSFWHEVDDRPFRMMSVIHEFEHAGYHTAKQWEQLLTDPALEHKAVELGRRARDEAIDYSRMTPAERNTVKKLMTAWGWTRGASTWTARFPFQHPVQARVGEEVGKEGSDLVDKYYGKLGGMAPEWLRGFYPYGNKGTLLDSMILNPAETPARLINEAPGLTQGQTENIMGEIAPVPKALMEEALGQNSFGTPQKGEKRLTVPLQELARRFEPLGVYHTFTKKTGATAGGGSAAAAQYLGAPWMTLQDPKKMAELGTKDYEQALDRPEAIKFRYEFSLSKLPAEIQTYTQKVGAPPPPAITSRLRADLEAVQDRDLFQVKWANQHNAKTWRTLPAVDKLEGTIKYLEDTHHLSKQAGEQIRSVATRLTNDSQIDQIERSLWSGTGIGAVSNSWKQTMKKFEPATKTPSGG